MHLVFYLLNYCDVLRITSKQYSPTKIDNENSSLRMENGRSALDTRVITDSRAGI